MIPSHSNPNLGSAQEHANRLCHLAVADARPAAAADLPPVLGVESLVQRFGGRTVLELTGWTVAPGRHSLVLGPSGCGKSTLLHLIAGLLRPSRGRILVGGCEITALRPAELDRFRGQRIGIVLQNLHLISAISVRDNLRLARSLSPACRTTPSGGRGCWTSSASPGSRAGARPSSAMAKHSGSRSPAR